MSEQPDAGDNAPRKKRRTLKRGTKLARLTLDDPEDEKLVLTSIRLRRRMLDRLDYVAERETAERKKKGEKRVLSRNDIVERFLGWALDQYWEDRGGEPELPPHLKKQREPKEPKEPKAKK